MDIHRNSNIIGFMNNPKSTPIVMNTQCTYIYYNQLDLNMLDIISIYKNVGYY